MMKELLDAIEKVKKCIERHRAKLTKSEALTRYALIDPILRALNWDTEDPEQVVPELSISHPPGKASGRPDYALFWQGEASVVLEAKSLGGDLYGAQIDALRYCGKEGGAQYFVVTDGNVWELYEKNDQFGDRIFSVCLSKDDPADLARKLLALWRPAMPNVEPAPAPLVQQLIEHTTTQPSSPSGEGIPLSKLKPSGKREKVEGTLRFPDGQEEPIDNWAKILVAVARWALPKLQKNGRVPLQKERKGALISQGSKGLRSPREIDNNQNYYVETRFNAAQCVKQACYILEEAGTNPAAVELIRSQAEDEE